MEAVSKGVMLANLKRHTQALAMPGQIALALYDEKCDRPWELAEDFHHWHIVVRGNFKQELSVQQMSTLEEVDGFLDSISGQTNAELWTEEAVIHHPVWETVRSKAIEVLNAFGWPVEEPPYIG